MHASTHNPAAGALPEKEKEKKTGLLYWSQKVVEECDKAAENFAADPVHDLRVAIRRCRSMADGFLSVDPDPAWKQMKRLGKPLFSSLGELRDVQVMAEWVEKLSAADDPARQVLLHHLKQQESDRKTAAQHELANFDRKHWLSLNEHCAQRAQNIPPDGAVFQVLALERWNAARELHRQALRNRSGAAYHQLRIGVKRLRYTIENFLPTLHQQWAKDLRDLQDALGEVHDFDVLWGMLRAHPEIAANIRQKWHETILRERNQRLALYRERMVGRHTLWDTWRAALPSGEALEQATLAKLSLWASLLDPHFDHAERVAKLALHLYDGLTEHGVLPADRAQRRTLQLAALTHEIGRSKEEKGHQKRSYRMLRKATPPPGWTEQDIYHAAIVARYHRGAIAPATHKMFSGIASKARRQVMELAGVLRLANAMDRASVAAAAAPIVSRKDGALFITVHNLDSQVGPEGERLARAKYLLEATCGLPIKLQSAP